MSAGTPLILNLTNTSYCETVFGGTDPASIAERFSTVDPEAPAKLINGWKRERLFSRIPRKLEALDDLPQRLASFIAIAPQYLQEDS